MVHKSISLSITMAEMASDTNRMFATWLITHGDVAGCVPADPRKLRAMVVPLLDMTTAQVAAAVDDAVRVGLLARIDGHEPGLVFVKWSKHQKLLEKRETPSEWLGRPTHDNSGGVTTTPEKSPQGRVDQVKSGEGSAGARAHAHEEQSASQTETGDDPFRAPLLAALRSHSILADLGHQSIVDGILTHRLTCPAIELDWYVTAIAEAVGSIRDEQGGGSWMTAVERSKRVGSFCRRAKAPPNRSAPAGGPSAGQRGAFPARAPTADEELRASNERARAQKVREERAAPTPAPTAAERKANAANARGALAALTGGIGNGGVAAAPRKAMPPPASLPPLESDTEADERAAEKARGDLARLREWEEKAGTG